MQHNNGDNQSKVEFDQTSTTINIQTNTNMDLKLLDLKLLSGQSSFKASALKSVNNKSPKKALRIKIQPQFLPKKDVESFLMQEKLFELTQQVLPEVLKKLLTQKLHCYSFTWVKSAVNCSGKTHKEIEKDSKLQTQLSFIEFLVYFCTIGEQINKLQTVSGMEEKDILEALK